VLNLVFINRVIYFSPTSFPKIVMIRPMIGIELTHDAWIKRYIKVCFVVLITGKAFRLKNRLRFHAHAWWLQ
jgi:hypothetical protein